MNSANLRRWTVTVAMLLVASDGYANSWVCQQYGLVREITIFYPNAPELLPCKVFYTKSKENALPRPLWTASHEEGYCERKAQAFVQKLQRLGWQCESDAVQETADP